MAEDISKPGSGDSQGSENTGDLANSHGKSPISSATRVLSLLDLFTLQEPVWTVEMFQNELRLTRATAYRYARELQSVGFIAPVAGGGYVLGPRFVEFDRQIRLGDPLLKVAPQIMERWRENAGGAQLLCTFYGDRVLTIHQDKTDDSLEMSMERGRPFPVFRGAPSRIILAHLPSHQLRNMFLAHSQTIEAEGLGKNWQEFRDGMKAIRKKGFYVGSEIDAQLTGVAAPIFSAPSAVIGCLCFVRARFATNDENVEMMARDVRLAAAEISEILESTYSIERHAAGTYPSLRSITEV